MRLQLAACDPRCQCYRATWALRVRRYRSTGALQ